MSTIKTISIKKILDSDTIKLGDQVKSLLGKKVEIIIREIEEHKPVKKKWQYLGSVSLGQEIDSVNIRDFAYDDWFAYWY